MKGGSTKAMRKYLFLFVLVVVAVSLVAGCGKKSEPLEDMQQPMSPEDLNRLKTSDINATQAPAAAVPGGMTTGQSVEDVSLEPLPPSGPYKPTAKEIQTALKNAGYYEGTVDGKIGPKSKQAIEDFQKANGLEADGKVGPKTWAALSVYLNAAVAAPVQQ